MLYFKVKPEFDQMRRRDGSILIGCELYTQKEVDRFKIPMKALTAVNISKRQIYFSFGARFQIGRFKQ